MSRAGSLYPDQIYLHVKPGRIENVRCGTYYYHPLDHSLVMLAQDVELDRDIHIPFINTPVFDRAAFSVFIVAQLGAIAPSYGDRSMHFVTIEAGLISHVLETAAASCGIGLCHIGTVDFDRVRDLFALEESQRVHIGGQVAGDGLDRHCAIEPGIPRRPDIGHTAAPDVLYDCVLVNLYANVHEDCCLATRQLFSL